MSFELLDLSSLSLLLSPHHLVLLYFTIISFSIVFHYHLSLFSTLFVSLFFFLTWSDDPSHFFWYIEDSHITLFFVPSFDIDSEILA